MVWQVLRFPSAYGTDIWLFLRYINERCKVSTFKKSIQPNWRGFSLKMLGIDPKVLPNIDQNAEAAEARIADDVVLCFLEE